MLLSTTGAAGVFAVESYRRGQRLMSMMISWKVGSPLPKELKRDPFEGGLPKPAYWISVNDTGLSLMEGINIATMTPPTFVCPGDTLSESVLQELKEKKHCTLSIATTRERHCLPSNSSSNLQNINAFTDLTLIPNKSKAEYPPAVDSSPIQMFCRLTDIIPLDENNFFLLIEADSVSLKKEVLSVPIASSTRKTLAKIDGAKTKPISALGYGRYGTFVRLHSMYRPSFSNGKWETQEFTEVTKDEQDAPIDDAIIEYSPSNNPLGYNPLKAIILNRPIGWISCYYKQETIHHLAPFSFFINLSQHYVAFSSYTANGYKDSQLDVEEYGYFGVNTVTPDLAKPMNLSSAGIDREESEFEMAGVEALRGTHAPLVKDSPFTMVCKYVKTVNVGAFALVIGRVLEINISEAVLKDGLPDQAKIKPVTRCGYEDEYAVVDQIL